MNKKPLVVPASKPRNPKTEKRATIKQVTALLRER